MHSVEPIEQQVARSIRAGAPFIKQAIKNVLEQNGEEGATLQACLQILSNLGEGESPFDSRMRPRPEVAMAFLDAANFLRLSGEHQKLVALIDRVNAVVCPSAIYFGLNELAQHGDRDVASILQRRSGSPDSLESHIPKILQSLQNSDHEYPRSIAPVAAKWFRNFR